MPKHAPKPKPKPKDPSLKQKKVHLTMDSYSIIGDLMSYLRCPRAYRKIQKGNLTPSRPSQLWFGNFVHGVMEALVIYYQLNVPLPLPLRPTCGITTGDAPVLASDLPDPEKPADIEFSNYADPIHTCAKTCAHKRCLYKVCDEIRSRLAAEGLYARSRVLLQSAIFRLFLFLQCFTVELFPIICGAEIPLKGVRNYSNGQPLHPSLFPRSRGLPVDVFYEIHGIADVISQVSLNTLYQLVIQKLLPQIGGALPEFYILKAVGQNLYPNIVQPDMGIQTWLLSLLTQLSTDYPRGFEMILDYKGQIRPKISHVDWTSHSWQMRTYKWLRDQQTVDSPVICGIMLYFNEIYPMKQDLQLMVQQSLSDPVQTDLPLDAATCDLVQQAKYDPLAYLSYTTLEFRAQRAIHVINFFADADNEAALTQFDRCVLEIQWCNELERQTGELQHWRAEGDYNTCTACDARYTCRRRRSGRIVRNIPTAP